LKGWLRAKVEQHIARRDQASVIGQESLLISLAYLGFFVEGFSERLFQTSALVGWDSQGDRVARGWRTAQKHWRARNSRLDINPEILIEKKLIGVKDSQVGKIPEAQLLPLKKLEPDQGEAVFPADRLSERKNRAPPGFSRVVRQSR
jgi:hypothetical protein